MTGTVGDQPSTLHEAVEPTPDEKVVAFDSFWGNAGTYDISGDRVTVRPTVAIMPNYAAGGFDAFRFRVEWGIPCGSMASTATRMFASEMRSCRGRGRSVSGRSGSSACGEVWLGPWGHDASRL